MCRGEPPLSVPCWAVHDALIEGKALKSSLSRAFARWGGFAGEADGGMTGCRVLLSSLALIAAVTTLIIGSVGDSVMRMREAPAASADETPVAQAATVPDTTNIPLAAAVAASSTPDELSAAPTAEPEVDAIVVQAKELLPERSGPSPRPLYRPAKRPKVEEPPASRAIEVYIAPASHGTWLFPPNPNGGG